MDKKLQLSKETLLSLEDTDLAAVAGGMGAGAMQSARPNQVGAGDQASLLCSTVCDSVAVCASAVCNSAVCNTAVVCL